MGSSTAVVTPAPVILDQVKDYLGITVTTYDTQISMIATQWTAILNSQILAEYLTDSSLDGLLDAGKLLCICGQVQNRLGSASSSTGAAGDFSIGNYSERNSTATTALVIGAKNPLYEEGLSILKPYMNNSGLALTDSALSSNTGYYPEFQIAKYDEDGLVVDGQEGTMVVF